MIEWIQQYWLQAAFTIMLSGICYTFKKVLAEFKAFKFGLQAMLRNDIISLYNKCMARCPSHVKIYEMQNMDQLYEQYKSLGGNGAIKALYNDFLELPTDVSICHKKED